MLKVYRKDSEVDIRAVDSVHISKKNFSRWVEESCKSVELKYCSYRVYLLDDQHPSVTPVSWRTFVGYHSRKQVEHRPNDTDVRVLKVSCNFELQPLRSYMEQQPLLTKMNVVILREHIQLYKHQDQSLNIEMNLVLNKQASFIQTEIRTRSAS